MYRHTNGADNAGQADTGCLGVNVQGAKVLDVGVNLNLGFGFRILK